ncbi:MAG: DUF3489 domain-containing protein [Paracoccaceae bacterium]
MSNDSAKRTPNPRAEILLKMLRRKNGASIDEIVKATDWQPHSARAMISGLKKKGHAITREKAGKISRYSIASEAAQ